MLILIILLIVLCITSSVIIIWLLMIVIVLLYLITIIPIHLLLLLWWVIRCILISVWSFILESVDLTRVKIATERESSLRIVILLLLRSGRHDRGTALIVLSHFIFWSNFVNLRMLEFDKEGGTLGSWRWNFLRFSVTIIFNVAIGNQRLLRVELRCGCSIC